MKIVPRFIPLVLALVTAGSRAAFADGLELASFNAGHPLKIMCVGDSITDDCKFNGAWRQFLQPLLETNGYHFVFVGRNLSTPSPGFTEIHHEGHCGAVVAAPGAFNAGEGYVATNNDLLQIVPDALARVTPDLVLVLIGANDIGRGRNPYRLATNDMSHLLDVIFSHAPKARVILAKITTLQNSADGYAPHAGNVPIYNVALQAIVNARRASGEQVFLADMFSAVDYHTGFTGDHLHPNLTGLKAIADEWFARIAAITDRPDRFDAVLINSGSDWKYSAAAPEPGNNWMQADYDDSAWSNGIARLGDGDAAVSTPVDFGSSTAGKSITIYLRRSFVIPDGVVMTNFLFRLSQTDGAAVYLNGHEVFRTNLPDGSLTSTSLALSRMSGDAAHIFYPHQVLAGNIFAGTNLVAVEVHKNSAANDDSGFDLELMGSGHYAAHPAVPSP